MCFISYVLWAMGSALFSLCHLISIAWTTITFIKSVNHCVEFGYETWVHAACFAHNQRYWRCEILQALNFSIWLSLRTSTQSSVEHALCWCIRSFRKLSKSPYYCNWCDITRRLINRRFSETVIVIFCIQWSQTVWACVAFIMGIACVTFCKGQDKSIRAGK